jgi:hypothetical protein
VLSTASHRTESEYELSAKFGRSKKAESFVYKTPTLNWLTHPIIADLILWECLTYELCSLGYFGEVEKQAKDLFDELTFNVERGATTQAPSGPRAGAFVRMVHSFFSEPFERRPSQSLPGKVRCRPGQRYCSLPRWLPERPAVDSGARMLPG